MQNQQVFERKEKKITWAYDDELMRFNWLLVKVTRGLFVCFYIFFESNTYIWIVCG